MGDVALQRLAGVRVARRPRRDDGECPTVLPLARVPPDDRQRAVRVAAQGTTECPGPSRSMRGVCRGVAGKRTRALAPRVICGDGISIVDIVRVSLTCYGSRASV